MGSGCANSLAGWTPCQAVYTHSSHRVYFRPKFPEGSKSDQTRHFSLFCFLFEVAGHSPHGQVTYRVKGPLSGVVGVVSALIS